MSYVRKLEIVEAGKCLTDIGEDADFRAHEGGISEQGFDIIIEKVTTHIDSADAETLRKFLNKSDL